MLIGAGIFTMAAGIAKTVLYVQISSTVDLYYSLTPLAIWLYVSIIFCIKDMV